MPLRALLLSVTILAAAEGGPGITIVPAPAPGPAAAPATPRPTPPPAAAPAVAPPAMMAGPPAGRPPMPRMFNAAEVELVQLEGTTDKIGLARWAELAGNGYRLAQVLEVGDKALLFFERSHNNNPQDGLQLPAAVEADPELANPLRAKLLGGMTARRQQQEAAQQLLQQQMQQRRMPRPQPGGESGPVEPPATH